MSAIAGIVHMHGQQALWEDSWRLYASLGHIPADTTGYGRGMKPFSAVMPSGSHPSPSTRDYLCMTKRAD